MVQKTKIKIGTRKSKLAIWQANYVAGLLEKNGFQPEIIPIKTKGDKVMNVAISKIGSKGVFTEELENRLQCAELDIAVHSAKDLPSSLPSDFEIIAICERELPDDVVISNRDLDINKPGLTLGTSSTRRIALLKHFTPHITAVNVRGNLQTRISNLENGGMDGLILAYAGVKRMNYEQLIRYWFDRKEFLPAVGQGAIAIESSKILNLELKQAIRHICNHEESEKMINCERAFLKKMGGGCSIPVFAYATEDSYKIHLSGGIASLDGTKIIVRRASGKDALNLGNNLGNEVLKNGGREILKDIMNSM